MLKTCLTTNDNTARKLGVYMFDPDVCVRFWRSEADTLNRYNNWNGNRRFRERMPGNILSALSRGAETAPACFSSAEHAL